MYCTYIQCGAGVHIVYKLKLNLINQSEKIDSFVEAIEKNMIRKKLKLFEKVTYVFSVNKNRRINCILRKKNNFSFYKLQI